MQILRCLQLSGGKQFFGCCGELIGVQLSGIHVRQSDTSVQAKLTEIRQVFGGERELPFCFERSGKLVGIKRVSLISF